MAEFQQRPVNLIAPLQALQQGLSGLQQQQFRQKQLQAQKEQQQFNQAISLTATNPEAAQNMINKLPQFRDNPVTFRGKGPKIGNLFEFGGKFLAPVTSPDGKVQIQEVPADQATQELIAAQEAQSPQAVARRTTEALTRTIIDRSNQGEEVSTAVRNDPRFEGFVSGNDAEGIQALIEEKSKPEKSTSIKGIVKSVIVDGEPKTLLINPVTGETIADLGKPLPKGGIRLSTDKEGNVTFESGDLKEDVVTSRKQLDKIQSIDVVSAGFDDLESILKEENIGLSGAVRKRVFGFRQQSQAFQDFFVKLQKEVQTDAIGNSSQPNKSKFSPDAKLFDIDKLFDESLDEQDTLATILAYRLARSLDPGARLSDVDVENAKKVIGLNSILTGKASIKAKFGAIRRQLGRERQAAERRLGKKVDKFVDPTVVDVSGDTGNANQPAVKPQTPNRKTPKQELSEKFGIELE